LNSPAKLNGRVGRGVDFRGTGASRRGSILVVVLVVLVVLALGAYTFSESMIVEARATAMFGRDAQARAAADSGVELAASLLTQRYDQTPDSYYNNPEWFQGVLVQNSQTAGGRGRFSVVSPIETDPSGRTIRFGLVDESSKLNINLLPTLITDKAQARVALQYFPEMTPEIADAILDWIDADRTIREMGAEDETYSQLGYKAKNGPLDSLDELLLVRGVTPQLLFGEDANRNGMLDVSENDGELSPPIDNADGLLDRGWSAFLTVNSRETNLQADGTPRVDVNMNALGDLFDKLAPLFDEDTAKFVIAYRMAGPKPAAGSSSGGAGTATAGRSSGGATGGTSAPGSPSSTTGTPGTATGTTGTTKTTSTPGTASTVQSGQTGTPQTAQGVQGAASAVSSAASMAGSDPITRGGINVTAGGQFKVNSLYDLIGVQVQININGTNTTLDSPWSSETSTINSYLPKMMALLTIKSGNTIDGRLNINHARRETIRGLPNMTDTIADAIVAGQAGAAANHGLSGEYSARGTTGWLLVNGIMDLTAIRTFDKYITAQGDVYRIQSVGYFEKGGPSARIEAVIDATEDPPAVVFMRDLTDLGRGFSAQLLTTGSGPAQ
jgi:Type II secretion system (T2SS), protein K